MRDKTDKKELVLPRVRDGYKRGWYACRECGDICYSDFIPYGLSNPITTLPCGHGIGESFYNQVRSVTEAEAIKKLKRQYSRVVEVK